MAQFQSCMTEVSVEGRLQKLPKCRKEWTVWTGWSSCPSKSNDMCKNFREWRRVQSSRVRRCEGFGRYCFPLMKTTRRLKWDQKMNKFRDIKESFPIMDVEKVNCFYLKTINSPSIRNQVNRCGIHKKDGNWGAWSMWSRHCDVTCGWVNKILKYEKKRMTIGVFSSFF